MKREKIKITLALSTMICSVILLFGAALPVEAGEFVYPKSKHSAEEMYEKGTDFAGGNPGNPGKKGNSGKPGKMGSSGKKGDPGKGRIVLHW